MYDVHCTSYIVRLEVLRNARYLANGKIMNHVFYTINVIVQYNSITHETYTYIVTHIWYIPY